MLKLYALTCSGRDNAVGLSGEKPVFNWKLSSDLQNTEQVNYSITVCFGAEVVWSSGTVLSQENLQISYKGPDLQPHRTYRWSVTVIDNHGQTASAESSFFTGKLCEPWQGKWIGSGRKNDKRNTLPPELFSKSFTLDRIPESAMLYISAKGIYEASCNGQKVGSDYFAPGYTHYQTQIQFQTYDVSRLVQCGENGLRVTVANGWYMGRIGNKNNLYGDRRGVIAELHLFFADGTKQVILSDETWLHTIDTPLRFADFYDGQVIDYTKSDEREWRWNHAVILNEPHPVLIPHLGAFVREDCRLEPVLIGKPNPNTSIYDFEQNFAGVIRLRVKASKGTVITVRHSEILAEDGSVYTKNLRTAKAELKFICGTDGLQEFDPRFTFMGFRYAEVRADRPIEIHSIRGIVLTSNCATIGQFECSNELLNRLQQNIQWGQTSNFIDIPTDCPQRDERMGWTGDIAVFASTAAFNRDIGAFTAKWLRDLRTEQASSGAIPVVIPFTGMYAPTKKTIPFAGWGDAATMVPWAVYLAYGDKTQLEEQYDSMKQYVEAERRAAAAFSFGKSKYLWNHNPFQFGDWCAPGEGFYQWTQKGNYLATSYFANSVDILRKTAIALGKQDDANEYAALHQNICDAFTAAYWKGNRLTKDFQSNYACALYFGLLPESERPAAAERLAELVAENGYCVMTGFLGTPYTAFALADNGQIDTAYQLLQNTKCPGWLYTVKAGATTIWERWDALDENGNMNMVKGISDMVSFNHYAYGAVGDFFYRRILGVEPIEPGYRRFRIQPVPGGGLTRANGSLETRYGKIECGWHIEDDTFILEVTVPCNTTCVVILPDGSKHETGSGQYCWTLKNDEVIK